MSEGLVGADAEVVDLAALARGAALCVRWYDEFLAGHEPSPVLLCDGLRALEAVGTIPGVVGDAVGLLLTAPQDVGLDTLVTALDLLRRYAHGAHDEGVDLPPADAGVQMSLPFDEASPSTAQTTRPLRLVASEEARPASRRAYW